RASVARRYRERLASIPGVTLQATRPDTRHAHHLFPAWIDGGRRDGVVDALQASGIGVVVNYRAVHLTTSFRDTLKLAPGTFPNAERIGDSTLSLPFYADLPDADLDAVVDGIRTALGSR